MGLHERCLFSGQPTLVLITKPQLETRSMACAGNPQDLHQTDSHQSVLHQKDWHSFFTG